MTAVDQIARAECAQFLFRLGFPLAELATNEDLRIRAADVLVVRGGVRFEDSAPLVMAVAEYYAP